MKEWDCTVYVFVRVKAKTDKEAARKALTSLDFGKAKGFEEVVCESDDCVEVEKWKEAEE